DEVGLVVAPFYHKNGLYFATLLLAAGQKLVLLPRFEVEAYRRAIVDYRCTWLTGVPTMFALLLQLDLSPNEFRHVRRISLGSAPLSKTLLAEINRYFPNADVTNGYGTTEAGPVIFSRRGLPADCAPDALGRPANGVELKLVDGDDKEGVLAIRAPSVTPGYLNLKQRTAAAIVDGWYITGDVVCRDENDVYYFKERADDMFVCGGENIFPITVEKVVEGCNGVSQAAVIAVDHPIKGQVPVAYVVREPGVNLREEDVKAWTLAHGPAYAHPREIIFVDSLPIGSTLKIDKRRLLADYHQRLETVLQISSEGRRSRSPST
ncbi:MAG: fatty acid--CoA ligase family protein, partial [Pirellulales bacterium]